LETTYEEEEREKSKIKKIWLLRLTKKPSKYEKQNERL